MNNEHGIFAEKKNVGKFKKFSLNFQPLNHFHPPPDLIQTTPHIRIIQLQDDI